MVVRPGDTVHQRELLRQLVDLHYDRNDAVLTRGHFRVRGDTVELHPVYEQQAVRIELFGDEVERIRRFDALTGDMGEDIDELVVFASTHYVAGDETMRRAIVSIEAELGERLAELEAAGQAARGPAAAAAHRATTSRCWPRSGCATASRTTAGTSTAAAPGEPPYTLLDFFPPDFLTVIDESHVAVPQIHGQYEGDRSRKDDPGRARLPAAVGPRQPAPHLRRVHRPGGPGGLPVGHARGPTSSRSPPRWSTRSSGPPAWSTPRS